MRHKGKTSLIFWACFLNFCLAQKLSFTFFFCKIAVKVKDPAEFQLKLLKMSENLLHQALKRADRWWSVVMFKTCRNVWRHICEKNGKKGRTYVCIYSILGVGNSGHGVIQRGDVRDDGLLIWMGHIHIWSHMKRKKNTVKSFKIKDMF